MMYLNLASPLYHISSNALCFPIFGNWNYRNNRNATTKGLTLGIPDRELRFEVGLAQVGLEGGAKTPLYL